MRLEETPIELFSSPNVWYYCVEKITHCGTRQISDPFRAGDG